MHNKLFVVDNQMGIVGGRNIGNEYFGLAERYTFRDLDVLVIGPVIKEISHAFDEFWNSNLSYPGSAMSKKAQYEEVRKVRERAEGFLNKHSDTLTAYPRKRLQWDKKLSQLPLVMQRGKAHFLQDKPVLFDDEEHRLWDMLEYLAKPSHEEVIVVTPYLIPVGDFLERMARLSSEGVKIKILTGSMGANNHTVAHSHYKKYRRRILAAGAELYEFKHDPSLAVRDVSNVPPVNSDFISLHIKALVGDRQRCFVGSLNLDPRAVAINTENGLYIESLGLCDQLADQFDILMSPENAWRVYVNADNQLRWESDSGTVSIQPARSFWQRIADFFFRLLPIESQL